MMQYFQLNCGALKFWLIPLLILSSFGLPIAAQANESDSNQGLPAGTIGGGSRGDNSTCSIREPLLAFIPDNHVLKTTDDQPTLWFYLPNSDTLNHAEFIIYDENERAIVDETFSIADQSGLFGINLSNVTQEAILSKDQDYRWFFSLICPGNRAADISVDGWIQPTDLPQSLESELSSISPVEQANLYVQEGLWSEAMLLLLHLYDGRTPADDWDTILQTISSVPVALSFADVSRLDVTPILY